MHQQQLAALTIIKKYFCIVEKKKGKQRAKLLFGYFEVV